MACYHPLTAWKPDEGGSLIFYPRPRHREIEIPCGQCIGCRLERSRQWAIRCLHESQMHEHSVFVTLTYNDNNLPYPPSLNYRHFQLFLKRLRKTRAGIRFFMCGEYGDELARPHYHALLFNCFFDDRQFLTTRPIGTLYRSPTLERLWPFGFSSVGDVTFESAAYVARYCVKKVTGPAAEQHYTRFDPYTGEIYKIEPEFCRMSLRRGIAFNWYQRYSTDVFDHDNVVIRGKTMKPPRYYDNILKATQGFSSDYIQFLRQQRAQSNAHDNTTERLLTRELYAKASLASKKRVL